MSERRTDSTLEEWGHPQNVTDRQRRLWTAIVAEWRTFAGDEPQPSLDIGGANQKGRTVTLDPFPRGPVDVKGLGELLPFKDGVFGSVVLESVLKHVLDPLQVLSEARRVLKSGSLMFVTSPVNHTDHHRHSFSTDQLLLMMKRTGFRIVKKKGIGLSPRLPDRMLGKLGPVAYSKLRVPTRLCSVLMIVAEAV